MAILFAPLLYLFFRLPPEAREASYLFISSARRPKQTASCRRLSRFFGDDPGHYTDQHIAIRNSAVRAAYGSSEVLLLVLYNFRLGQWPMELKYLPEGDSVQPKPNTAALAFFPFACLLFACAAVPAFRYWAWRGGGGLTPPSIYMKINLSKASSPGRSPKSAHRTSKPSQAGLKLKYHQSSKRTSFSAPQGP